MADFKLKPEHVTKAPTITVDGGLAVGEHTFQLVVVDESGNRSKPAEIVVTIFRPTVDPRLLDLLNLRTIGRP